MSKMTQLPGVPDSEDAIPGMAYFAGTGPLGKTCGGCWHRGMFRTARRGFWNNQKQDFDAPKSYRYAGCAMFKALTGEYGPAISADNHACKYFEAKNR